MAVLDINRAHMYTPPAAGSIMHRMERIFFKGRRVQQELLVLALLRSQQANTNSVRRTMEPCNTFGDACLELGDDRVLLFVVVVSICVISYNSPLEPYKQLPEHSWIRLTTRKSSVVQLSFEQVRSIRFRGTRHGAGCGSKGKRERELARTVAVAGAPLGQIGPCD